MRAHPDFEEDVHRELRQMLQAEKNPFGAIQLGLNLIQFDKIKLS